VAAMLGIPRFELAGTSVGAWPLRIGITLTLVGTAALVWLLVARRVLTPRLAGLIVALGSYWSLLGVARAYTNNAGAPRYVYPAAILMLLIAVEATSSMAIARAVLASLAVVALGATALNVHWLDWNGDLYRIQSRLTAAELGALEVERASVAGDFRPITRPGYPFDAAGYFKATDQLESTVATAPGRLAGLPARDRAAADMVMIRGAVARAAYTPQLRTLRRLSGDEPAHRRCAEARGELTVVVAPQAGLVVRPGGAPVGVGLRRFASDFAPLPPVTDGPQLLLAPLGRSSVPWVAQLTGRGRFRVC
jgi:hypothetical protein